MKCLLFVGLFLTCALGEKWQPNEFAVKNKDALVDLVNKLRKNISESKQIANMHELRWSEKLAKEMHVDCDWGPLNISVAIQPTMLDGTGANTAQEIKKNPERLCQSPLQTEIGCIHWADNKGHFMEKCVPNTYYCRCGPKKTVEKDDFIIGKPQSKCGDGQKNGLCKGSIGVGGALNLIFVYLVYSMW